MMHRISKSRITPVKLELPDSAKGQFLTLIALGNLVRIDTIFYIWCLFCNNNKQIFEALQPLSLMPYFPLGSTFNNGHLVNSYSTADILQGCVSHSTTEISQSSQKLQRINVPGLEGRYAEQYFIAVNNHLILLPDLIIRTLCPDPDFSKIALTLLSGSFIFKHVLAKEDHLHAELETIYDFHLSSASARQLALLAGSDEYRSWHRSIALYSGEALAARNGGPWRCPLPDFKLKVDYMMVEPSKMAPFNKVVRVTPDILVPYKKATFYLKGKSQTMQL